MRHWSLQRNCRWGLTEELKFRVVSVFVFFFQISDDFYSIHVFLFVNFSIRDGSGCRWFEGSNAAENVPVSSLLADECGLSR